MVATKGGLAGTVLIDAYQTVSGERVPSKMQISYGGLPLVIDAALQQARVLPKADPALFAVPSSAADYQFLGAQVCKVRPCRFRMITTKSSFP